MRNLNEVKKIEIEFTRKGEKNSRYLEPADDITLIRVKVDFIDGGCSSGGLEMYTGFVGVASPKMFLQQIRKALEDLME